MKTNLHIRSHLAQFFLEREMFDTKVLEKIKTQFMSNNSLFPKIVPFTGQCGKIMYSQTSHIWLYNAAHAAEVELQTHW